MRWLRENALPIAIDSMYCSANNNVANIFSKPLGKVKFVVFRDMIGIVCIY